jgi:hypothetical protein
MSNTILRLLSHGNVTPEFDADHDHREHLFPESRHEVTTIVHAAFRAIEVYCQDALPMSGIGQEYPSYVWSHFE